MSHEVAKIKTVTKSFNVEDVEFELTIMQDGSSISDYMSFDDKDTEDEIVSQVEQELEDGSTWAWCIVTLNASWAGFHGVASIGAASILSDCLDEGETHEDYFREKYGYYDDMKSEALEDLIHGMKMEGWTFS